MITSSLQSDPSNYWLRIYVDSSASYFGDATSTGFGVNTSLQQNNPSFDKETTLWWRLNANYAGAGKKGWDDRSHSYNYDYDTDYYNHYYAYDRETLFKSDVNFDFSLKFRVSAFNYFGFLAGYGYEYAQHTGYYQVPVDTNNDGLADTTYDRESVNEHRFRAGFDIDLSTFNLKPYYTFNSQHQNDAGPGLEVLWNYYPLGFSGRINFNQKLSKVNSLDAAVNVFFLAIGYRLTNFSEQKMPTLKEIYLGANISIK